MGTLDAVTPDALRDIARSGVLAPSADNQHVFRIEFADAAIRLWPTPEFAHGTERHRQVMSWISLGAVTENMRLRAGGLGFASSVRWFPLSADRPFAQVDLVRDAARAADPLAAAIPSRCTNRRMYRGPALTSPEQATLAEAASSSAGVQLHWFAGRQRRSVQGLMLLAESERFRRRRLHAELFGSIRFDLPWRGDADLALAPAALEVEPPMRPMFKALRHWGLMQPLTWVGAHWMLGLRAGWMPAWRASGLGVLATGGNDDASAVRIGVAFQRLWLQATLLGLAMQPMAASVALPFQRDEDDASSAALRGRLTLGWSRLVPGLTPMMVFRIGRAAAPSGRSVRRPLETYLRT